MSDQKELKRIAGKIAKCLALANSSNPAEAETAKRQADALMRKYSLSVADVGAAQVREVSSKKLKKTSRQPIYLSQLAAVIAEAFGCKGISTSGCNQYTSFLGFGSKPELASYVFDVLRHQINRDRNAYKKTLSRYKTSNQTKLCNVFCEGWVTKVARQVRGFSGTAQEDAAIEAYKAKEYADAKDDARKPNYDGINQTGVVKAMVAGQQAAQNVSLFHPISGKSANQISLLD